MWPFDRRKPAPLLDKNNPESEPDASDVQRAKAELAQGEKAAELVALVTERFELAAQARQDLEPEWAQCIAFERGYSHLKYNAATRSLQDGRDPDDMEFWRPTNLIRTYGSQAVSRFTALEPGALIQPLTQRDLDAEAARELRVAEEHYNAANDSRSQLQRITRISWTVGDSFLLQYWDPTALATVPVGWDSKTGETIAYEERPVGNLIEQVVPGWEVYADPRAARWEDCQWMIHAVDMPIGEVERRYGHIPEAGTLTASTLWTSLRNAFTSPWIANGQQAKETKLSTVLMCYEKRSLRYPKGRTIVTCGDELLYSGELPCGMIPLLHLGYQEQVGTCYHRGIVCDLVEPQFTYNLLQSRWLAERNNRKYIFFRDPNDGGGADVEERLAASVEQTGNYVTIWSKGGAGQLAATPTVHSDTPDALAVIERQMADIAGVHVNQLMSMTGDKPSGYALRIALDADNTQNAPFSARLEKFIEERARRRGKILGKYVREPRAWGLDNTQNPEEGGISVSMLPALTHGGSAVVRVVKGSLTPTTPEAQDSQIQDWATAGLLGDPASSETHELVFKLLSTPAASRALEALKERREMEQKREMIAAKLESQMPAEGSNLRPEQMPATEQPIPQGVTNGR